MSVNVEARDHIALVTLSSDDGLNLLSCAVLEELAERLHDLEADSGVDGIVLQSSERCFSAGADIDEFPLGEDAYEFLHRILFLLSTPERINKPVVAAVNGPARAGGFELAMACDWIVATPRSTFGLPEVTFGFVPGYCMSRLPYLVGEARAKRLMLDPGPYSVEDLCSFGIHISSSQDVESPQSEAEEICRRMTAGTPESIRLVKRFTNRLQRSPDFEPVIDAYNYLFGLDAPRDRVQAFRARKSAPSQDA